MLSHAAETVVNDLTLAEVLEAVRSLDPPAREIRASDLTIAQLKRQIPLTPGTIVTSFTGLQIVVDPSVPYGFIRAVGR